MTKLQLIEIIKRRLTGDGFAIHDRVIEKFITLAINTAYYQLSIKNKTLDIHTKTYDDIPIQYDSHTNQYYCTLPTQISNLPGAGAGIHSIFSTKKRNVKFVPTTHEAASVFADLEVNSFCDEIGYRYHHGVVEFSQEDRNIHKIPTVSMELIRPFEDYDDDEEVFMPTGGDEIILKTVLQMIAGIPKAKMVDDNNPNTP